MKRFITIFSALTALFIVSCKCPEYVTTTETEKIIEVRTHDTTIVTAADSASIRALFRCDSAFNVILDELVTMQGDRIETELQLEKVEHGGVVLKMDCKEDSLRNEIQLRDSIIKTTQNNTTVIREKYVPRYYKNVSVGFWILLVILLVIVGFKAYKIYLKIQSGGLF